MRTALSACLLLFVCSLAWGCGRIHTLRDGPYAFEITHVLRDDCYWSEASTYFSSGTLVTSGNQVELAFSGGKSALVGTYQDGREAMVLDGTVANTIFTIRQQQCVVESLALHVETTTVDAATFTGSAALSFRSRTAPECSCEYWYAFRAARAPPSAP